MSTPQISIVRAALLALSPFVGTGPVAAEEPVANGGISLELSAAELRGQSCLLSFVAENTTNDDLAEVVFETVLFGAEGQVALLTLLDFEQLPVGRPRVRQFQFDGLSCDQISRVLINGAEQCQTKVGPTDACTDALRVKSRLNIDMIG